MSTFNPLIPLNTDSPGIFPSQSRQNFTRLRELIGADHQFNDTAQGNDGYHNLIHLSLQAPTGALAGTGRLYSKIVSGVVQLFYMDSAGIENQITPRAAANGLFAAVNFNGISGAVIRSSFNVSSVGRASAGNYVINFTNPAPNNNYLVMATGMRDSDNVSNGQVAGAAAYGSSVTTTFVNVKFNGQSNDYRDVIMGNVMVYII